MQFKQLPSSDNSYALSMSGVYSALRFRERVLDNMTTVL